MEPDRLVNRHTVSDVGVPDLTVEVETGFDSPAPILEEPGVVRTRNQLTDFADRAAKRPLGVRAN